MFSGAVLVADMVHSKEEGPQVVRHPQGVGANLRKAYSVPQHTLQLRQAHGFRTFPCCAPMRHS